MIQRTLRIILVTNIVTVAVLFALVNSPLHHNILANWWVVSTGVALILFILEIVKRQRGKTPKGIWIDASLLGAWVCALGFLIALATLEFRGF